MSPRKSLLVAGDEAGERLDRLLARHVVELSRSRLKALIEAGAVAVDGRTIRDPSHRVNSGAAIAVEVPAPEPAKPAPEPIPLKVVYEDDDIIVIDKPRNLVVHPAAGNWTGTLVNALIAHCGDSLSGIGGERRPGIVHRLDKDTTGLMVVAKNDRAHRSLAAQFADHGRERRAVRAPLSGFRLGRAGAAPWGDRRADRSQSAGPRPHGGPPRWPRGRHSLAAAGALWRTSRPIGAKGKPTKAGRAKAAEPVASLLNCRLETGRTHQIRVHLASIGHPLMGDEAYGAGFRTKAGLLPPGRAGSPGRPWQTGPACLYTDGKAPHERRNPYVPVGTAARSRSFT